MTGDQWLTEIFEPALADEQIRYSNVVERWRGALRALEACGLLNPAEAAKARRRLKDANQDALRRTSPRLDRPGSVALPPTDSLRQAFAPLAPLIDFEGVTLVLVSVELWTRSVRLRIAGLHNATSDELDDEYRHALQVWGQRVHEAHSRDMERDHPPRDAGARMLDMRLRLTDDLGTQYRPTGSQAGGGGSEWRLETAFEPGAPADARDLTIEVDDFDGNPVHELPLPLSQL